MSDFIVKQVAQQLGGSALGPAGVGIGTGFRVRSCLLPPNGLNRTHVPPSAHRVPRRLLPRHLAGGSAGGDLCRRAGSRSVPERAAGRLAAIRRFAVGLLPDGQPLPPGAADGAGQPVALDAPCEWRLHAGLQPPPWAGGASVPGALQGGAGRFRRLPDGALPLRGVQPGARRAGGACGRLGLVQLPGARRAGRARWRVSTSSACTTSCSNARAARRRTTPARRSATPRRCRPARTSACGKTGFANRSSWATRTS